jgi:hypothetical protein
MSGTLTVRVNPKDPTEMAVDTKDGSWSSWATVPYGYWKDPDDLQGWHEFTLEVPDPPRDFVTGDVVTVKSGAHAGKRAVRLCDVWYADNDSYIGGDKRIVAAGYTYVGNLKTLS